MAQENHYDLVSTLINRQPDFAVFNASENYHRYLQNEGLISTGEQIRVKTSSSDMGAGEFPKAQLDEFMDILSNQRMPGRPRVLHWVVGFSMPVREWGVPLPVSEYNTPFRDEDGVLVQFPEDHHGSFVIDSHRYGSVPERVDHVRFLTSDNTWMEEPCAPFLIPKQRDHLSKLMQLKNNPNCPFFCSYMTVRASDMPAQWQ